MGSVTSIEEYRPHMTIPTEDGNCHILPVTNIQEFVDGKRTLQQIAGPDSEMILRALLRDYLASFDDPT